MARKNCPEGTSWNYLLIACIGNKHCTDKPKTHRKPNNPPVGATLRSTEQLVVTVGQPMVTVEQPVVIVEQPVVTVEQPGASVASGSSQASVRASGASVRASSAVMLSPALWSCVVLIILGSVLALGIWAFIYRRQRRQSRSPDASVLQENLLDPLDKLPLSETTIETSQEAPSHCPHLHTWDQAGFPWGDGGPSAGGGPTGGGRKDAGPPPACAEGHRIPLPATELGGTALVTTKTV